MNALLAELISALIVLIRRLPGLLVAFGLGKKIGEGELKKAETAAIDAKLELEKKENEIKIEKKRNTSSSSDIIDDAIKSGRKALERRGSGKSE